MGLLKCLFGATRDAIAIPNFDSGTKAVEISATMLRECIDLGSAGADGPNRGRLARPFARGYLFGFSDACIQRFGVFDELESLALVTVVHGMIFGHKIGSLLVHDALRDQGRAEFGCGRTAGAVDLRRWLDDRSYTPLALTDYLHADDAPVGVDIEHADVLQVRSNIDPLDEPTRHAPSRWNSAHVRLPTKTVKPISH
jgi:hypothetical protein